MMTDDGTRAVEHPDEDADDQRRGERLHQLLCPLCGGPGSDDYLNIDSRATAATIGFAAVLTAADVPDLLDKIYRLNATVEALSAAHAQLAAAARDLIDAEHELSGADVDSGEWKAAELERDHAWDAFLDAVHAPDGPAARP